MNDARRKVEEEGRCRRCKWGWVEAAHVIPRSLGGGMTADSVIPLCPKCHRAQHDHDLELLPLLNEAEQIEAVRAIGLGRAYRYLTNQES